MAEELKVKQRSLEDVKTSFSKGEYASWVIGMVIVFILFTFLLHRMWQYKEFFVGWIAVVTFVFGQAISDFGSGIFHWAMDTWGSIDTPILGQSFIKPFREHHVDEKAITHHDFFFTAGLVSAIIIPLQLFGLLIPITGWLGFAVLVLSFSMSFGTLLTNQAHKFAHMENPPKLARFFQKLHLILPKIEHHQHHIEPFTEAYAITNGWMNPFFRKVKFFRKLEMIITKITGTIPRVEDIGLEAAKALMENS